MQNVSIIAAVAANGVIGYKGKIPWNFSDDLKLFRKRTLYSNVIMGHNTYKSLSKPLDNRLNIVITSRKDLQEKLVPTYCNSFQEALYLAEKSPFDKTFIIGGASIYLAALRAAIADKAYITMIEEKPAGDTYFPWEAMNEDWFWIESEIHRNFKVNIYERVDKNVEN